ncbi:MAG: hypothetical protein ACO3XN_11015, partial [Chthoniobacterales bacterium]
MSDTRPTTPLANAGRLASYLTVGVTGSLLANAHSDAAIVMIDLTNVNGQNITGANAGLSDGNKHSISNWLGTGTGRLEIYSNYFNGDRYWGLDGDDEAGVFLDFAVNGSSFASPRNFGASTTIDGSSTWTGSANRTVFKYNSSTSPDFGAGSFMGFRFGSGSSWNYGYLEVTWNSTTNTFQILSGAYESTANTSILA